MMRNGCMTEVWRGDGFFDEKDAEDTVGCGDGETYSTTMYESPVLGKAARWVERSKRTTPPERDSALHSNWRGEETRTSDEFEIRRVCSETGRDSDECQTLKTAYNQTYIVGKAMRAK